MIPQHWSPLNICTRTQAANVRNGRKADVGNGAQNRAQCGLGTAGRRHPRPLGAALLARNGIRRG